MDFPIVDAHQHFWELGHGRYPWLEGEEVIAFRYGDIAPLKRSYLPPDYFADAAGHQIVATVHMEAEWDPADPVGETRWIEGLNRATGFPTVCVAQAWLDRADVAEVLAAQAASPLVRGIRQKPRAAASPEQVQRGAPGSMGDPAWRRGYALLEKHGLSYDLQTPWWHLEEAAEIATAFPRTTLILNHTGLPADRSEAGLAGWRAALRTLAECPNACLKISGLGRKGLPWTLEANGPIIRDAIAIFGADRCLFASNYPVDRLAGPFDTIFSGFREAIADLPPADQRKLFHDNAIRLYRLPG
jgi:predicted TIM-barrel fold metal-dependent hydrolase